MTKRKILDWLKENQLVCIYAVLAILIECTAVFAVEGDPLLSRPFVSLGLLVFMCGVLFLMPSDKMKTVLGTIFLVIQTVIDLIFAAIFDMTGQYFAMEMLSLRNDAVAVLEEIPVNFFTFYVGILCCIVYVIYGLRLCRKNVLRIKKRRVSIVAYCALSIAGLSTLGGSFLAYFPNPANKYETMVKGSADSVYASYGMVGNLLNELGNVIRGDGVSPSDEEIESFIYQEGSVSEKSKYFGNSKDKNVVVVLSESLEWYAFRKNKEMYPNALDFTEEELALLYPNLTKFYEDSVVMTNFHSKEKTDISETLSIVGQYPTGKYVTYDFYANAMPQSLPNILDEIWPSSSQFRSYHNGDKKFYNRHITHKSFGFDEYTAREDMRKMDGAKGENPVFTDWKEEVDDYNLDSEMIELCKDEMFPTDKRFFTYITTITMHGVYGDRQTLQDAKEEVEAVLGDRMPDKDAKEDEDAYRLFNYMVTAKELDKAVGCMVADLEKKGLLDKTTIMLFGDHEAYYDEMSSKVKDIFDYDTDRNFTDLYNVPLMIRDADLKEKVVESEGDRFVDKFVCTADLMPTLLDLLGIRYFSNLYYGRSAFVEKESVIYSRSYNFFMTDGIVGRSVEGFLYKHPDITQEEIAVYQEEAKATVEKVRYCDYIFRKNFFAKDKNMSKFLDKMAELNS